MREPGRLPLPADDPAHLVPPPPEPSLPAEFAPMSTTLAAHCENVPDPASLRASATRYLVVPHPPAVAPRPDEATTLVDRLGRVVEVVRSYDPLLLVEVDGTPESMSQVQGWPDVAGVYPALGNLGSARSFALGLSTLSRIAQAHRSQTIPVPFAGIPVGAPPGYPALRPRGDGRWEATLDESTSWPTAPAIIPVVNLSVGPSSVGFPFLANDIVNIATFGASAELLVVVAAGNCGELGMSPWAQSPWVLGVGATEDEAGTQPAAYSSRGPADGSRPGPDLVAWGTTTQDGRTMTGTSFAAPRVTHLARLVVAAFLQLGRQVRMAQGEPAHGVPLVGLAYVDQYGADIWRSAEQGRLIEMPALPILGVLEASIPDLVELTTLAGVPLQMLTTPTMVRELLLSAATPIPGYGPHEVGAGFVDIDRVVARLATVSGLDLVSWFGPAEASAVLRTRDPAVASRLADLRVFDPDTLRVLDLTLRSTGPVYFYDWQTRRLPFAPLAAGELDSMNLDERLSGSAVP